MAKKYFILLFFITIFVACNSEEDTSLAEQIVDIEDYLETAGYDYELISGVYRFDRDTSISDSSSGLINSSNSLVLEKGDSIFINYVAYVFDGGQSGVFDTNVLEIAEYLEYDLEARSFEPLGIKYGTTQVIKGLELGLSNVSAGDFITIIFPCNLGYDSSVVGLVPSMSALSFDIDVIDIKSNN